MRFLAFHDGKWRHEDGLSREEAHDLALGPVPVWVRAEGVAPDVWSTLGDWFELHALALEDLENPRQRPKVENYDDMTFIVIRAPRDEPEGIGWAQVGIFVGQGFVLTASQERMPELDAVEARLLSGGICRRGEPDRVMYHIVDAVVDAFFPFLDQLEERLEEIEDHVIDHAGPAELAEIRGIKQIVGRARKVVPPMREAALSLERVEHPNVRDELRIYLRDVADHMVRIGERLDHIKEMTLIAQETWSATLANSQNETMKRLTVIAALLLLPGLLAGLGGMNFPGIPEWNYWSVVGSIAGLVGVGFAIAVSRRWL